MAQVTSLESKSRAEGLTTEESSLLVAHLRVINAILDRDDEELSPDDLKAAFVQAVVDDADLRDLVRRRIAELDAEGEIQQPAKGY